MFEGMLVAVVNMHIIVVYVYVAVVDFHVSFVDFFCCRGGIDLLTRDHCF